MRRKLQKLIPLLQSEDEELRHQGHELARSLTLEESLQLLQALDRDSFFRRQTQAFWDVQSLILQRLG